MKTESGSKELKARVEADLKPCPACAGKHTYTRKLPWGEIDWPSQRMDACKAFVDKTATDRAKLIQDQGGCRVCCA